MNANVEKLESLLSRIRRNRHAPRRSDVMPAVRAPDMESLDLTLDPSEARVSSDQDVTRPAEPMEIEFQSRLSPPPSVAPVAPVRVDSAEEARKEPEPALASSRVEAALPEPSGPILRIVSTVPERAPQSFGELIARTLALRPR